MAIEDNRVPKKENESVSVDLDKLLDERERLDELIKKKFTKTITIMFTDMKGSSSIAESEGDVISRSLIKKHNDILLPVIREMTQSGQLCGSRPILKTSTTCTRVRHPSW
jgi:class 3 adenylate cyclase